jgi:hypothetical protein
MLFAFVFFYVAFHVAIQMFRSLTGKEKWEFAKTVAYSLGLSLVVVMFLVGIVILF